jgi:cell division protein FtsL
MQIRTGDIGALVFEQGRRGSLRRIMAILAIVALLLLYVGGKVKIVQLGYQLEALEKEKRDLERENSALRIEAASLASPARIEEIALKRLGMVRIAKENLIVVKRQSANAQLRPLTPRTKQQ